MSTVEPGVDTDPTDAAAPTLPFTMLGDSGAAACEDGVCVVPEPPTSTSRSMPEQGNGLDH